MKENPKTDWAINPEHTWAINPVHTWAINPDHTWAINPVHTWIINPIHTWTINPVHTWAINPDHTWTINPKHDTSLKPDSPTFAGFIVREKNTDIALYYTVDCKIKEKVLLIFDYTDRPVYVAVGRHTGFSVFDYNTLEYIGYWEYNGKNGYNWFDLNNNWIYYVL